MVRTKGSGWGNGKGNNWLICPKCGKKKMLFWVVPNTVSGYTCHYCKTSFDTNMNER